MGKRIMEILILGLTITRLATENQRLRDKLCNYDLNNQKLREDFETKIEDLTGEILTQEDELIVMECKLTEKDLKIKELEDTITVLTRDLYNLAQSSTRP